MNVVIHKYNFNQFYFSNIYIMKFFKKILNILKLIKNKIFRLDIFITIGLVFLSYFFYNTNKKYTERFTQDEGKNLLNNIKVQND